MKTKYLFVTGGVCSSLGKGLTAAVIGLLLEKQSLKVALLKIDPYLNVDPGTMSPFQHGEVYVTDDGTETDLDLGHYWRYTHSPLSKKTSITTGQVYETVISKERRGDYLGKTVQVIPHVTEEIKKRIHNCSTQEDGIDVVIVEVGGTVGDIESLPFLEALRQFRNEHYGQCLNIHLTYVPYLKAAQEIKSKPTQQSVHLMRGIGIQPDFILCRSEQPLPEEVKQKISLFCNIPKENVIDEPDVKHTIYEVPLHLKEQKLDQLLLKGLDIPYKKANLDDFEDIVKKSITAKKPLKVGVVGKYVQHKDAYKSVYQALDHAAIHSGAKLTLQLFESDKVLIDGKLLKEVEECDAYLVPGGFGERGWKGKLATAQYARTSKKPYFGICLGMQAMVVEFAKNVLKLEKADSTEIDPNTPEPVIDLMEEQKKLEHLGGTLRLGSYPCKLSKNSLVSKIYKSELINERHRHRFELNNRYINALESEGLHVCGKLAEGNLAEVVEIPKHPWMIGVQFHPEFKSRPTNPHPLFISFIRAGLEKGKK